MHDSIDQCVFEVIMHAKCMASRTSVSLDLRGWISVNFASLLNVPNDSRTNLGFIKLS